MRCCVTLSLIILTSLLGISHDVFARPDMQPLGPNIADKGSDSYRFSIRMFNSADGQRHYKVWTAVPRKAAPAGGYPVLYMLDGNAAMNHLSPDLLQTLAAGNAPVLIAVGYQTPLPFDLNARTYDYTPPQQISDKRGRPAGGSPVFRQLLEHTIAPEAEKGLRINVQQRGIWGHSYGGLFILDSYLSSHFFQRYYAASPSLRGDTPLMQQMRDAAPLPLRTKRLVLMEGDGDTRAGVADKLERIARTIGQMSGRGISVRYQLFPGLSHGPMFPASLDSALMDMANLAP